MDKVWVDENVLKLHISVAILATAELYTLNGCIISQKLFFKNMGLSDLLSY